MQAGTLLAILFFCAVTWCTWVEASGNDELFQIEPGQGLLFAVKAHTGNHPLGWYLDKDLDSPKPTKFFPTLYRSKLLNNLKDTVTTYKAKYIVVEMRTERSAVLAQAKFDVSRDRSSLTSENWFSASRLVSTLPFKAAKTGFDVFSIRGYRSDSTNRSFYISYKSDDCTKQRGLMGISEMKWDGCPWLKRHSIRYDRPEPVLFYATRNDTYDNSAGFADQFLIYLELPKRG